MRSGEEIRGNSVLSMELVGGRNDSGTCTPCKLCVGCPRGWNSSWDCYLCWSDESFPGTFEDYSLGYSHIVSKDPELNIKTTKKNQSSMINIDQSSKNE